MSNTGKSNIYLVITNGKPYYHIKKRVDGKQTFYGSFKTLEEAKERKKFLLEQDWDLKYAKKQKKKHVNEKYITFNNPYYIVQKYINGKSKTYGHYKTLDEAVKVRDYYISVDWKKEFRKYNTRKETRYITLRNGKYIVQKWIDGKLSDFGAFNRLEEAQEERDLLVKYDWDYTAMVESEGT